MKSGTGALVGSIVVGLITAVVGYAAGSSSSKSSGGANCPKPSPPPPPPPPPPPGGTTTKWVRALFINPGDRVRMAMSQAALTTVMKSVPGMGGYQPDLSGFLRLLSLPVIANVLQQGQVTVWGPGDQLPSDWPQDDPDPGSEFHADFPYKGTDSIPIGGVPLIAGSWWKLVTVGNPQGGGTPFRM